MFRILFFEIQVIDHTWGLVTEVRGKSLTDTNKVGLSDQWFSTVERKGAVYGVIPHCHACHLHGCLSFFQCTPASGRVNYDIT